MAWLFMTIGGILAGQMIYRWRKDIILTTVVTVVIALLGIVIGTIVPSNAIIGDGLANSRFLWALAAFVFCYFASVLPIWRFALPINYVASYIVFLGLLFGIIGFFTASQFFASRLLRFYDSDWPALADDVCHHCVWSYLRLAQHCLELRDSATIGK